MQTEAARDPLYLDREYKRLMSQKQYGINIFDKTNVVDRVQMYEEKKSARLLRVSQTGYLKK